MNRQEALSFLDKCRWWFEPYTGDPEKWHEAIDLAIEALKSKLPTGEWVKATGVAPPEFTGRYVCSNCGHYALMNVPYGSRQELSPFCPWCGADMKGGT